MQTLPQRVEESDKLLQLNEKMQQKERVQQKTINTQMEQHQQYVIDVQVTTLLLSRRYLVHK